MSDDVIDVEYTAEDGTIVAVDYNSDAVVPEGAESDAVPYSAMDLFVTQEENELAAGVEPIVLGKVKCRCCGMFKNPNKVHRHLCDECVKVERNRYNTLRRRNEGWLALAKEAGIELWERQPAETDSEWKCWLLYRDAYPGKKPTYRDVAEEMGTTISFVSMIASRWNFQVRMQAWAKHIDTMIVAKRQNDIMDMNLRHVVMAENLNKKLSDAIDLIDPKALKPTELSSLFKLATDVERKARMDSATFESVKLEEDNPALKKSETKLEDMGEILSILNKAGVLNPQAVGIKQTMTTEVVMKNVE